jgi:hypothetical protein
MTMHLAHPALTTLGKRKGKKKWASAEQKRNAEQLEREWQQLQDKWKTDLSDRKRERGLKAKVYKPPVNPRVAEIKKFSSIDTGIKGAVNIKQPMQYTGDKIIGIGTMHKSNAVPIFNDEAAKDISKMRR